MKRRFTFAGKTTAGEYLRLTIITDVTPKPSAPIVFPSIIFPFLD
jgi:hypothetical protein